MQDTQLLFSNSYSLKVLHPWNGSQQEKVLFLGTANKNDLWGLSSRSNNIKRMPMWKTPVTTSHTNYISQWFLLFWCHWTRTVCNTSLIWHSLIYMLICTQFSPVLVLYPCWQTQLSQSIHRESLPGTIQAIRNRHTFLLPQNRQLLFKVQPTKL